jgi:hypothetical protein
MFIFLKVGRYGKIKRKKKAEDKKKIFSAQR